MLFIDEYTHTLDFKNKMIILAKLRDKLVNRFVITKGLDGCLYAYPLEEWKILENKLKTLPLTNRHAGAVVRFIFSGACEIELNEQVQRLIPQNLKEYAGIEKDIVSIRVLSRVEICSKEKWNEYNNSDVDFDSIAEKMNDLGI